MKKNTLATVEDHNIVKTDFRDVMFQGFARYSKKVIQDRALPDVRDGLKPVHRRILYAMFHEGNTHNKAFRKSAKTVGNVIGNYHPHGDISVYEAMVNMSQWWKNGVPLIEMQGNNGSIDGDSAAAMRYTESRLSQIANYMLENIDEKTVEFMLNYSDSELEPMVLPAAYCNLLVNGATGIAIGYATEIPQFNFHEIMQACIYRLLNPRCDESAIFDIVLGPDFPTGGFLEGKEAILQFMRTGKGRLMNRSKVEIKYDKKVTQLVVTEITYAKNKSEIVKKIVETQINKNLDDILDVRDESDRHGLKIVVDLKPEADAQTILNLLYKETDLQCAYNANMNCVVDNRPKLMGVVEIIDAYLDFRVEVFTKRTQFRLLKKKERLHILDGLMLAISHLDEVIAIIRRSQNKQDSKHNLVQRFNFSENQVEAIVTLQLYRLSNTDIVELRKETAQLLIEIEHLQAILDNSDIMNSEIVAEFKAIDALIDAPRKTEIMDEVKQIVINPDALISEESVYVTISKDGYIKRVSSRSYQSSNQYLTTIKQGDVLIGQTFTTTLDYLVGFTKQGSYFVVRVHDIPDYKWKEIGTHYSSIFSTQGQEQIVGAFLTSQFEDSSEIILTTKFGKIKRVNLTAFEPPKIRKLFKAMNLSNGDEICQVFLNQDSRNSILLLTKQGMISKISCHQIPVQQTGAGGVTAIKLEQTDEIIYAGLNDALFVVTWSEKGQIKRIKSELVELKNRPNKGQLIAKRNKSQPVVLKSAMIGNLNDGLLFNNGETLLVKEVALMDLTQTFTVYKGENTDLIKDIQVIVRPEKNNLDQIEDQIAFDLN